MKIQKNLDIISDADAALSLAHLSFLLMEGIDIGERLTNFKTFTNEVYADQRESGLERFVSEALNEIGFQVPWLHENRNNYPFIRIIRFGHLPLQKMAGSISPAALRRTSV